VEDTTYNTVDGEKWSICFLGNFKLPPAAILSLLRVTVPCGVHNEPGLQPVARRLRLRLGSFASRHCGPQLRLCLGGDDCHPTLHPALSQGREQMHLPYVCQRKPGCYFLKETFFVSGHAAKSPCSLHSVARNS
jgi:hypothetical protein